MWRALENRGFDAHARSFRSGARFEIHKRTQRCTRGSGEVTPASPPRRKSRTSSSSKKKKVSNGSRRAAITAAQQRTQQQRQQQLLILISEDTLHHIITLTLEVKAANQKLPPTNVGQQQKYSTYSSAVDGSDYFSPISTPRKQRDEEIFVE